MKAFIKGSRVIDGNTAAITAVITHAPGKVNPETMRGAIQAALGNRMTAIAGTFNSLSGVIPGAVQTIVHGAVKVTTDVVAYVPETNTMKSVSSNMFMDSEDNIWNLKQSESGKVLVRSNYIDNQDEINELLQSCSSVASSQNNGNNKELVSLASDVATTQKSIQAGQFVAVASAGKMLLGAVVAKVFNSDTGEEGLSVLPVDQIDPVTVSCSSVMHNEGIQCKDIEGGLESVSGANTHEKLVTYYRKVYGYNAQYFAQLEQRIRNYAFA